MKSPHRSPTWRRSLRGGLGLALARLRFVLLLGLVVGLMAAWPTLRNLFDTWTAPAGLADGVSSDTEFWCPMCPGVSSQWPGKCPVCHMALVVRQKGEMTPLPDGVVARMQFAPYRIQLAGIRTSPVEFRQLRHEVILAGLLEAAPGSSGSGPQLTTEVYEGDVGLLRVGQELDVASDAFPGTSLRGRVDWLASHLTESARTLAIRVAFADPHHDLRPGMYFSGRIAVPLADLPSSRQLALEAWRFRVAAALTASNLAAPLGVEPGSGWDAALRSAVDLAALHDGMVLAIPESAVIDTGLRKVVFLEQAPGLFDAVEVQLSRRCGEFFPVVSGLEPGQKVVSAGAFLLDAETRLNPAAAASYFGAANRGGASATPTAPAGSSGLSAEDQRLIKRQQICPVTEEPLGSMGVPPRLVISGRTVFVCCEGCIPALRKDPGKYLAKLPK